MGAWGAGIAKEFYKRFPEDYKQYHDWCQSTLRKGRDTTGQVMITGNNIICLVTSKRYGKWKDCPTKILLNTREALDDLKDMISDCALDVEEIHMPKINAGLFKVPWEETEAVIKDVLTDTGIKVIVYEL
jgi:ADP-ribose 1''-phosphate phosphatase